MTVHALARPTPEEMAAAEQAALAAMQVTK